MGLFDFLSADRRRAAFAKAVIDRLIQEGWPYVVTYESSQFAISAGEAFGPIALAPLYGKWSSGSKQDRAAVLDRVAAYFSELAADPTYDEVKPLLLPVIRSRNFVVSANTQLIAGLAPRHGEAWAPFGDHLTLFLGVDRPHSLRFVRGENLRGWGCTFDEALVVAIDNLKQRSLAEWERQKHGFYLLKSEDPIDTTQLLLPERFAEGPWRGAGVAILMSPEGLVVAGADEPLVLEAMAAFVVRYLHEHPSPLSYAPMILQDGAWRPFAPPRELRRVRGLQAYQTMLAYGRQAGRVFDKLQRDGRPEAIAVCIVAPGDEVVQSLALWTESVCLLPRTDLVVLRSPTSETLVRAWEDVDAACGGLEAEPGTDPPYYRVAGWPDATALQSIAAAPEPAWTQGKGVGVHRGRLTLMG